MNIVIMITGSIVGVAYITELFIAWYSGVEYEQYAFLNRARALLVGVFNDDVL
jgi:molybdopterin-containing oxidoreductase family membrane subunit